MLTFDEATHTYYWNKVKVPNVTSIIGHLTDYSHIPPEKLEKARLEGQHVHKMVQLHFERKHAKIPEWMKGHREALLRFVDETGFWCADTERKVFHKRLRFAGTLDLAGGFSQLEGSKHIAIIDVKRSLYAGPAIGLQTEGYRIAYNAEEGDANLARERYALVLRADGTYRLTSYHDQAHHAEDNLAFLACLQQFRWREKHYGNR